MDDSNEDQRLPHHRDPKEFVSMKQLAGAPPTPFSPETQENFCPTIELNELCVELGVLYWKLNPNNYENDEELKKIREDRGYNYVVCGYSLIRRRFSVSILVIFV